MPNTSRAFYVFLVVCWLSLGLYALAARAAPQPPAEPHVSTALAATPYLRTVLPSDALAYVRLAHPWGLLGVPKGNMLSEALASEGVRAALSALQRAIVQQLLGPLQPQVGPLPGVLLDQVRAPLELAVLRPAEGSAGLPDFLLLVQLHSATRDDANALLQSWRKSIQSYSSRHPWISMGLGACK